MNWAEQLTGRSDSCLFRDSDGVNPPIAFGFKWPVWCLWGCAKGDCVMRMRMKTSTAGEWIGCGSASSTIISRLNKFCWFGNLVRIKSCDCLTSAVNVDLSDWICFHPLTGEKFIRDPRKSHGNPTVAQARRREHSGLTSPASLQSTEWELEYFCEFVFVAPNQCCRVIYYYVVHYCN